MATVTGYASKAASLGFSAMGLTDHGNMCGAPEFYKACRKAGVEPIIGSEFYFVTDIAQSREAKTQERYHVTILGRGLRGYEVLTALSTESHRNFYYKPLIDRSILEALGDDAQHLTVLSGCMGARLSQALLADEDEAAVEELLWWRETFPHYYIETMHHDVGDDTRLNAALIKLSKKYKIPHVITNDPHFLDEKDALVHDTLLAIQTASDVDDPKRFKFDGAGYWLKSYDEMEAIIVPNYGQKFFEQGVANNQAIAEASVTRIPAWESKSFQIPKFPGVEDPDAEMKRMCKERLKAIGKHKDPRYTERLKSELKVYKQSKIADFMLITADIIRFARSKGIGVGPGRGSAAGTLVGYLLDIHRCDPVKYNLLFERFLNPARPKMPDIDSDFSQSRRGEIFEYIVKKYGVENTMSVSAFGHLRAKSAFNAIAKVNGFSHVEAQNMNKGIYEDKETGEAFIPDNILQDPALTNVVAMLHQLRGVKSSIAAHPAGIIIADPSFSIRHQIPEMWIPSSKRMVGQYDKKAVDAMGFLKEDILGLRTLDTITEAVRIIEERTGERLDPDSWDPDNETDDKKVYKMLAEGKTAGVFQMEGPANRRGCKDVKPKNFEDLISITSLYRTGAISAGFPAIFNLNRLHGKTNIEYAHPTLKPILEDTWGVVLYQEQVMEFGRTLAGFDDAAMDDIKEAIKDKSSDDMQAMKPMFIKGCKKHSKIPKETAEKIWRMIEGYAGYGYNRSHAAAYTLLTYQTARLKCLYPMEYITALLRTIPNNKDNADRRDGYMREALAFGVKITPPSVNESDALATAHRKKKIIRFGLSDIAGIGEVQARKIVNGRPAKGYTSVDQVVTAVNNVGVVKALTNSSSLECLGVEGDKDLTEQMLKWQFRDPMKKHREKYNDEARLPADVLPDEPVVIFGIVHDIRENETKTGKKYLTWKVRWSPTESFDVRLWSETSKHWDTGVGSLVRVEGEWEPKWDNLSCGKASAVKVIKKVTIEESVSA